MTTTVVKQPQLSTSFPSAAPVEWKEVEKTRGLLERIDCVINELKAFRSMREWSLAAGRSHSQVQMMRDRARDAVDAGKEAALDWGMLSDLANAASVDAAWFLTGRGSARGEDAAERALYMFAEGADDPAAASAWARSYARRLPPNARHALAVLEEGYARYQSAGAPARSETVPRSVRPGKK